MIGKDGARLEISVMGTLLYQRENVRPLPVLLFYTTGGEGHGFVHGLLRTRRARTGLPLTDGEGASDHRALRWIDRVENHRSTSHPVTVNSLTAPG